MEVLQRNPLNTQPPAHLLTDYFLTPPEITFSRNHGEIPEIDEESYELRITATPEICDEIERLTKLERHPFTKSLSLSDIKTKWKQNKIVAALEVADIVCGMTSEQLNRRI